MIRDMFGDIVTKTEKRCKTCNELKKITYSHGGISSMACKCTDELCRKVLNGKIVILGEGISRGISVNKE